MKDIVRMIYVLCLFACFSCKSDDVGYGKAIITPYHYIYKNDNIYFPHDFFMEIGSEGMLPNALIIDKNEDLVSITNRYNDGFSGHKISFQISKALTIESVAYDDWTDVEDGSESHYTVEKIILALSGNPFTDEHLVGHYTVQIREKYTAGEILKDEGINDTTTFRVFNGKFKNYSEEEKLKGRDWVIDQNEISQGIKDSSHVYFSPDEFAEHQLGMDSLSRILSEYEIERSATEVEDRAFITLRMIIDERGEVEPGSMTIRESIKMEELLEDLQKRPELMSQWRPAIHNGVPVKSEVYVRIRVKE